MTIGAGDDDDLRLVIQQIARRIRFHRGDEALSDSQLSVLFHLEVAGPLTPSELAARNRVSPPSINRTLNDLETAGLVTRAKSDDDARKVIIEPTPAAEALLAETRRLRTAWFSQRLAALDPAERDALIGVLPVLRKLADT